MTNAPTVEQVIAMAVCLGHMPYIVRRKSHYNTLGYLHCANPHKYTQLWIFANPHFTNPPMPVCGGRNG